MAISFKSGSLEQTNMEKLLKTGSGWRLGWNPQAELYKGLVGSDDWAIELTEVEFNDFCRLLQQLTQTMEEMSSVVMESEKIACEAESDRLWLEVEGTPQSYALRLILHQGRCFEGNWDCGIAVELAQAIQRLEIF